MVLETHEPRSETDGGFTIAGVAKRDTDVNTRELWSSLDEYAEHLGEHTVSDEPYGVIYDIDERNGVFTYVAGYRVDSTDGLSPELTVVDVPETTYAVFETTVDAIDDVVVDIHEGEFGNVDHDREVGVLVQRYESTASPSLGETDVEFLVPLEAENDRMR